MIKYVEYQSFDDNGQHIIPVNSLLQMNKTASSYSPEIMKMITSMKRRPDRYYVVINALGSHEVWGCNRNGDSFPKSGLEHKSLRTDMSTTNDYGYKTFEYYAHLYKHHVNKDPKKSFGEVVFAYWNAAMQRVELIVGINTDTGKDIIDDLENDNQVAVSMGCKVKYDRCSICGNKAKTRAQYCKHLRDHMRQIISAETAKRWSRELGKNILPGTQVFAFNDFPRFFDISKVHVGADRTAYVLGKAASSGMVTASVDIADAMGVTDDMIDKIAIVGKQSEIEKNVGGGISPDDIDGRMVKIDKARAIRKAIDEKMNNTIDSEPMLPKQLIDSMSSALPVSTILSTLLGVGIHPKPLEFQRIILVRIGEKDLADKLEDNNIVFNYNDDTVEPKSLDISNNNFSDTLGKLLVPHLQDRSCFPLFLGKRVNEASPLVKESAYSSTGGSDYWLRPDQGVVFEPSKIEPALKALGGIAALYTGLKLKASGYGPKQLAGVFVGKPWLRSIIGGGVLAKLYSNINEQADNDPLFGPASNYENALQDTQFSGHITKSASAGSVAKTLGTAGLVGAALYPSAYIINAYNQRSLYRKGKKLFPGAGATPKQITLAGAGAAGAGSLIVSKLTDKLSPIMKKTLKTIK